MSGFLIPLAFFNFASFGCPNFFLMSVYPSSPEPFSALKSSLTLKYKGK